MHSEFAVDLKNCDREPIHIPGSVQGHGCLVVLSSTSSDELLIEQASENVSDYLGRSPDEILGARSSDIFGVDLDREFRAELQAKGNSHSNHFLRSVRLPSGMNLEVVTHTLNQFLVAEFERVDARVEQNELNLTIVNVMAELEVLKEISELGRVITRQIRSLTRFDRVLLYSFDPEGNGIVLAEDRNERLPPMLHLRFPATDIPQQARRLYLHNRVRIIPDVEYTPSPLLARSGNTEPLDMTYSILRSVSPVHRDYMRNMGTAGACQSP